MVGLQHPEVWTKNSKSKWKCELCKDGEWRDTRNAARHENGARHSALLQRHRTAAQPASGETQSSLLLPTPVEDEGPLAELLHNIENGDYDEDIAPTHIPPGLEAAVDYEVIHDALPDTAQNRRDPISWAVNQLQEWLADAEGVDPDFTDHLQDFSPLPSPVPIENDESVGGIKRTRGSTANVSEESEWYPWPDKETCILDILRHLPRSTFSDEQMKAILWGMDELRINRLPSLSVLKDVDNALQDLCGVASKRYEGVFGNVYYVNDMSKIVAQEMANPQISPHLHYYPEDAGDRLEHCWQGQQWLNESDPRVLTQMIRMGNQDYYVFEPAKTVNGDVVVPERWFTRSVNGQVRFFAKAWRTKQIMNNASVPGYLVLGYDCVEISAHDLALSFPNLLAVHTFDNLPDPRNIFGFQTSDGGLRQPWRYTQPAEGNHYRTLAQGHRCVTFMALPYCDDTSGNVSKKWNEHNSFLFTAAGLPRDMSAQQGNVHFLSTSNLAPPLEMLDGVVTQLEECQAKGFWAWDAASQEMVLVIIAFLAMLGDNPMQSELACHIGLRGKFFCRNCWVKGVDNTADGDLNPPLNPRTGNASDTDEVSSVASDQLDGSVAGSSTPKKTRRSRTEGLQQLVDRAHRFLDPSTKKRHAGETQDYLKTMFLTAINQGKTHYNTMKTSTGLKDNVLEYFASKIFAFRSHQRGDLRSKQAAVHDFVEKVVPREPYSPIWRIKGFDPHQDTPVEILHVILLGFIKYLWRDAIARLSSEQKALLAIRLFSIDVSGLGLSPLAGQTLVQFAGSLVGRDFRAISQVAPFVLYDLVPTECYETWLALSSLVPMVWQPAIPSLSTYLLELEHRIHQFLRCAARWTPRWFNKPKFHLLLHLPEHIRRFGPAMLFATENFESFNAVIRDLSVHSNCQAPSRDIARSMAQCNRIRHLLLGGYFIPHKNNDTSFHFFAAELVIFRKPCSAKSRFSRRVDCLSTKRASCSALFV